LLASLQEEAPDGLGLDKRVQIEAGGIGKQRKQENAVAVSEEDNWAKSAGVEFQTPTHKGEERVPRVEEEIFQQGFDMLKELAALA